MFRSLLFGLHAAAMAGTLIGSRLASGLTPDQAYRTMQPVTRRNIGRNLMRSGRGRYLPHQGEREIARRKRQVEAGQISFIRHGPEGRAS